jgi:hypothetical protein
MPPLRPFDPNPSPETRAAAAAIAAAIAASNAAAVSTPKRAGSPVPQPTIPKSGAVGPVPPSPPQSAAVSFSQSICIEEWTTALESGGVVKDGTLQIKSGLVWRKKMAIISSTELIIVTDNYSTPDHVLDMTKPHLIESTGETEWMLRTDGKAIQMKASSSSEKNEWLTIFGLISTRVKVPEAAEPKPTSTPEPAKPAIEPSSEALAAAAAASAAIASSAIAAIKAAAGPSGAASEAKHAAADSPNEGDRIKEWAAALESNNVIKEGFLQIKSGFVWRRKMVLISGAEFLISPDSISPPDHVLNMRKQNVVETAGSADVEWVLKVDGKTVQMKAYSVAEKREWLAILGLINMHIKALPLSQSGLL